MLTWTWKAGLYAASWVGMTPPAPGPATIPVGMRIPRPLSSSRFCSWSWVAGVTVSFGWAFLHSTFLFLIVWKWISQMRSTTSSKSAVESYWRWSDREVTRLELTVGEANEAEPAMTFCLLVHEHHSFLHFTELAEIRLHLLDGCVLWDAADEDLLRLVGRLRSVLWSCMFRINLFAIQCVNRNFQDLLDSIRFLWGRINNSRLSIMHGKTGNLRNSRWTRWIQSLGFSAILKESRERVENN